MHRQLVDFINRIEFTMPERLFRHNEIHIHAEMRPIRTAAMNSFSFADFLKTPQGETLHAWESSQYDEFSADAFGREALQVGAPQLDTLRANGITSQWLTSESYDELDNRLLRPTLQTVQAESGWLPFPAESLDLVTLPHALDSAPSAHQTLREAARVLVPEGRLILTVFNPLSLWWMRQKAVGAGLRPYLPTHTSPVPLYRLKDWLTLLGFEIDGGLQAMDYSALTTSLAENKLDIGAAALCATDERKEVMDFSDIYCDSGQVVMVNKNDDKGIKSVDDLKDKKIAVEKGTASHTYASKNLTSATLEVHDTITTAYESLEQGKVDAVIQDGPGAYFYIKTTPDSNLEVVGDEFNQGQAPYCVAISKECKYYDEINAAVKVLIDNGTTDELYAKWCE